jgi:ferredoxin--NADP+ reductase
MAERARQQVVAIIGGATAGAEAAGLFADRGALVVVFEQNARPYGKIEDGLPRWHVKLRRKEYELVNEKLDRPGVYFVPLTRIGRDLDFRALLDAWGFSAVVLAQGAWRDRPLPVEGADRYIGRGLVYQNALIHWFNHYIERDYPGPHLRIDAGAIVVGGGLASIDVMKVLQIESLRQALHRRGIEEDAVRIEHDGIPAVLAEHGLEWHGLGLRAATLFYRRRIEDMPLSDIPADASPARREKLEATRRRIVEKAMDKYVFAVRPQRVPVGLLVEGEQLIGLRFQRTAIEGGRAVPIAGAVEDVRAPLVVSSIGSVPEPMRGIPQDGLLYRYADPAVGRPEGYDAVFGVGNVVTGKGNILVSRRHSTEVSLRLIGHFLGLDKGEHAGEEKLLAPIAGTAEVAAAHVADLVAQRPPLSADQVDAILHRVRARQLAVGYGGNYREWIRQVTPPDFI